MKCSCNTIVSRFAVDAVDSSEEELANVSLNGPFSLYTLIVHAKPRDTLRRIDPLSSRSKECIPA